MKQASGWRQIKTRSLTLFRKSMESGSHFEDAMRQVHDILGPQFEQLPDEVQFKAWWDELGATRPSKLHSVAVEESRLCKLEARVTDLENAIRALTDRLEEFEG